MKKTLKKSRQVWEFLTDTLPQWSNEVKDLLVTAHRIRVVIQRLKCAKAVVKFGPGRVEVEGLWVKGCGPTLIAAYTDWQVNVWVSQGRKQTKPLSESLWPGGFFKQAGQRGP